MPSHCRQGRRPVQGSGAAPDGTQPRGEPAADDRRSEPAAAGRGRLFWLQPEARVAITGWLGQATPALRRLDSMEDPIAASGRTGSPRHLPADGLRGRHQSAGTMAGQYERGSASWLLEDPLAWSRIGLHGERRSDLIRRTAVVRTRMPGGVGGAASRDAPLSRLTGPSTARHNRPRSTRGNRIAANLRPERPGCCLRNHLAFHLPTSKNLTSPAASTMSSIPESDGLETGVLLAHSGPQTRPQIPSRIEWPSPNPQQGFWTSRCRGTGTLAPSLNVTRLERIPRDPNWPLRRPSQQPGKCSLTSGFSAA